MNIVLFADINRSWLMYCFVKILKIKYRFFNVIYIKLIKQYKI